MYIQQKRYTIYKEHHVLNLVTQRGSTPPLCLYHTTTTTTITTTTTTTTTAITMRSWSADPERA
jgi:hypothetical protein